MPIIKADIQWKKGPKARLPQLEIGVPAITTDTLEPFVGSPNGNIQLAKQDAVEQVNQRINDIAKVNANVEVQGARGTFPVLGDRLESLSSSVAQKLNKNESGTITWAMAAQDFREQITGGNTAVVGKNAVLEINLINKAVTEKKTSFFKRGKNLFDKSTRTDGYFVNQTNGTLAASAGQTTSDFIEVDPSVNYSFLSDANTRIAYYNADKVYISGAVAPIVPVTTPLNCAFVRFSFPFSSISADVQQFEVGTTKTEYESFIGYYFDMDKMLGIKKDKLTFEVPEIMPTNNLFNVATSQDGFYVHQGNGTLVPSGGHISSDFIETLSSTQYSFVPEGNLRIVYYNDQKVFISGALNPSSPITTPSNCKFVRFSFSGLNLSPFAQKFELGSKSTPFTPYGTTIKDFLDERATDKPIINLPRILYGLVGQELNIYFDNILSTGKDTDYVFDVVCSKGQQFQDFFRITPTVAEAGLALTINVYKHNKLVTKSNHAIVVKATAVGNAITKKVLVIGDSTTANGMVVTKINENFSTDVMKVSSLGTKGTAPNKHEGISGWTARLYTTDPTSPFVFGGVFNFAQYISTNALATPDHVIINLGINDVFSFGSDPEVETKTDEMIADYNTMITSIRAFNANIKIGIALTIPPNYSQDAFAVDYGAGQTRDRYKRNNALWLQKLIRTFRNSEGSGIFLIPINASIDTRFGFESETVQVNARNSLTVTRPKANSGVHPYTPGYWQIADVYWYYLKSFEI
ncbi:SGNH/GDSL hydrolase family protein [Neobacillus niacini]|uniref:SGNH/GDSL hydrolase family protein n=1 Tax=Neobacillus niacini TaxID=86668 RepID=UPI002FFF271D